MYLPSQNITGYHTPQYTHIENIIMYRYTHIENIIMYTHTHIENIIMYTYVFTNVIHVSVNT